MRTQHFEWSGLMSFEADGVESFWMLSSMKAGLAGRLLRVKPRMFWSI